MEKKSYTQFLTDADRVDISFTQTRGKIIDFRVNYSTRVDEKWQDVMRIDNCHGQPHKHIYHLHRRQYKILLGSDANIVFTWAKRYLIRNFRKIKENYSRVKPRT